MTNTDDCITWFAALTTYFNYANIMLFGHFRDVLGKILGNSRYFVTRPPKVRERRRRKGGRHPPPCCPARCGSRAPTSARGRAWGAQILRAVRRAGAHGEARRSTENGFPLPL